MYERNSFLKNKRLNTILLITFSLFVSSSSHALKDDISKPVYINADSVLVNKGKGFAVYEGNVSIVQGTLDIRAGKIEISAPNSEIQLITASGNPVEFQQKMDDGKLAKGRANRVVYQVKNKRIVLDGNAALTQNNDKFTSNHIEYSISNGELKAGNNKTPGKSRVKAVFYPSNKKKK